MDTDEIPLSLTFSTLSSPSSLSLSSCPLIIVVALCWSLSSILRTVLHCGPRAGRGQACTTWNSASWRGLELGCYSITQPLPSVRVNYCAKHITVCCCCELQYFFSVALLHLPQSSEVGNVFTFPCQSLPQAISSACPACWWSIVFRVPEGGNCSVCTCLYNHIQFWRWNVC